MPILVEIMMLVTSLVHNYRRPTRRDHLCHAKWDYHICTDSRFLLSHGGRH